MIFRFPSGLLQATGVAGGIDDRKRNAGPMTDAPSDSRQDRPMISKVELNQMNIGRLIAVWNNIEVIMRLSIAALLPVDVATAEAIMKSSNLQAKLDIFSRVVRNRIQNQELISRLEKIEDVSVGLWTFRNDIVHGIWQIDQKTGDISLVRAISGNKSTPLNRIDVMLERTANLMKAIAVSYTHLRAHETKANLVCRLLLEKKK